MTFEGKQVAALLPPCRSLNPIKSARRSTSQHGRAADSDKCAPPVPETFRSGVNGPHVFRVDRIREASRGPFRQPPVTSFVNFETRRLEAKSDSDTINWLNIETQSAFLETAGVLEHP